MIPRDRMRELYGLSRRRGRDHEVEKDSRYDSKAETRRIVEQGAGNLQPSTRHRAVVMLRDVERLFGS